MADFLQPFTTFFGRRRRDALLRHATVWPTLTAHLLKSTVQEKDPLATEGTAFQDRQVESAFYFTLDGTYYGGHLRSVPLSDSEAHRALRQLPEDTPIHIRYNPQNPDQSIALPDDNPGFPVSIWPA